MFLFACGSGCKASPSRPGTLFMFKNNYKTSKLLFLQLYLKNNNNNVKHSTNILTKYICATKMLRII